MRLVKQPHYKNCPALLRSYLRYLTVIEEKAAGTLEIRYAQLRQFYQYLRYLKDDTVTMEDLLAGNVWVEDMPAGAVADVNREDIYEYLDFLHNERNISENTTYRKTIPSLRQFYAYLIRFQEELEICIGENPAILEMAVFSDAARPARCLSPSEISRVIRSVEGEAALRDIAMIILMTTTGMTLSEIAKVRFRDYRGNTLSVAGRKVYLTDGCSAAIRRYILQYRDPIKEYLKDNTLFISHNYRRRLTSRGIQKALQKHFDRAGIEATARDLRHTAVMELLKTARNEAEQAYIAGQLGYKLDSIKRLPLPKPPQNDPVAERIESTWLAAVGRKED